MIVTAFALSVVLPEVSTVFGLTGKPFSLQSGMAPGTHNTLQCAKQTTNNHNREYCFHIYLLFIACTYTPALLSLPTTFLILIMLLPSWAGLLLFEAVRALMVWSSVAARCVTSHLWLSVWNHLHCYHHTWPLHWCSLEEFIYCVVLFCFNNLFNIWQHWIRYTVYEKLIQNCGQDCHLQEFNYLDFW